MLDRVLSEGPHTRADVADREPEQEPREAAQDLVAQPVQGRQGTVLDAATQPGARDDVAPGFQGLDELGNLFRGVRPVRIEHDVEPGSGDVLATPIVHQVVQRLPDAVPLPGAALHVDARAAVPGDLRGRIHRPAVHDPHVHVVAGALQRFHRDPFDHRADGHRLVEGREQDHDASRPDALRGQVPARPAFVDERSGTPEDPASVRTRTHGRPRPGDRKVLSEERSTEPRSKRRRLGPTVPDPLHNPERHLPSPPPGVGRRGSIGVCFGPVWTG